MTNIAGERAFLKAQGLDIIYREAWGAKQSYTSDRTVQKPVQGFFLHISVTIDGGNLPGDEHDDMRTIERIGQERFGIGFPYNAAVFDTGRLYEGQPLSRRGAHTVNDENKPGFVEPMNQWYRAIVLPQMVTDDVTAGQVHGCAKWAAAQIRAGYARRDATWNGHRDVSPKSCPGDAGYARLPEIRRLTEHYVTNGLGEDDMFGDDDEARLKWLVKFLRGDEDDVAELGTSLDRHIKAVIEKELSTSGSVTRQKVRELAFLGAEDAEDNDPQP